MKRVMAVTGGVAATATLLLTLGCAPASPATPFPAPASTRPPTPPATASTPGTAGATASSTSKLSVRPDDPAITVSDVTFPGAGATLQAYLAQPKSAGRFPAVLVCHENRGL
ncbi:MAG TPA: dienelactone hydrolase family protein, partial [Chloroflexota bacterium]|nr:dienelactone hydrolase family protein [Chloroflexota bacterium]